MEVSAVGLGCMGFTHGYGTCPSEAESIRLIRKAYDEGCTFFDTAEIYSCYKNEELVGKALKPFRDRVVISTKFTPATLPGQERAEGKLSRAGIRQAVEGSLRRLQTDYIDLYTEHRVPKESDPAEVAYWMGELIWEGKIRAWGQSEPTLEQLQAAHAVTPVAAVQSEYSIMERKWEADVIPFCREKGISWPTRRWQAVSSVASTFMPTSRATTYAASLPVTPKRICKPTPFCSTSSIAMPERNIAPPHKFRWHG